MLQPKTAYLTAISAWYGAFGMQSVVFAWLVTMVLREPAERVGIAQMTLLLPGMLLILIAGVLADRIGLRRQAAWSQLLAGLMPLLLAVAVYIQALSFTVMIIFALLSGCASAFLTPARDGLLNHVAGEDVQRTVMQASLCQFGFQILGYSLAGFADTLGAEYILVTQSLVLLLGVWAYTQLREVKKTSDASDDAESVFTSLSDGARTVISNPLMRTVVLQNVAMGCFFMGAFVVGFPLVMREVFAGSSGDLAVLNALNSLGLVVSIVALLRLGFVARAGQALVLAQAIGSVVLLTTGLVDNLSLFMFLVFMWGVCGGIAMPMSRTLMQQLAPPDQRARVMSFYAFSFMGAGPLGTLICGYLADLFGPQQAIVISAVCMLLVLAVISLFSPLWRSELEQIQSA
ncbi:MAG: MFS transporter [Pseudomonadota bacterium]|nr:MFS transporter [Pseudomonadota bacterium]